MSSKITQLHVYIIGIVVGVLLGVGLWYALIKPLNEENEVLAQNISSTETAAVNVDATSLTILPWPQNLTKAQEALEGAKKREAEKKAELNAIARRKQFRDNRRVVDIGDGSQGHLITTTMSRWLQLPQYVVQMMTSYARSTAAKRGVTVTTTFAAPAPSADPNVIPRDIIAWNLGNMTIRGDFQRVMRWVEDWNQAPLLVAVDGLKCSVADKNGVIEATATLTAYVFPTGQAVQIPGAGGGGGAAPAAPGGGAGYPGMPGAEAPANAS
jgi:hypothetical protein